MNRLPRFTCRNKLQINSNTIISFPFYVILICVIGGVCGCGSTVELSSAWRNREVVVDGSDSDWQGAITYVTGSNLAVGVRNDNEYLYVCIVTTDRRLQMQMLGLGLTAWFDPLGGKDHTFGIHFPLGLEGRQRLPRPERLNDPEEAQSLIQESQRELEILGPGKDERERMLVMQAQGISVKLGRTEESLVYELKVPLRKSTGRPYAIGADGTQPVGVGFETAEISSDVMRERTGGTSGSGTGRPAGGRGRSSGGEGPSGVGAGAQTRERPEPLKLWTRVQLATGDSSAVK